jgi:antitoxin (DNA-binding transcriptional repressor) of toxin-antitoxin stability system
MKWRWPNLGDAALISILGIASHFEYNFGRSILDLPWQLAVLVPVAVDSYVAKAMRARRDIGWAIALMILSVAGATIADIVPLDARSKIIAAGMFAALLAGVLARVHVLIHTEGTLEEQLAASTADRESASEQVRQVVAQVDNLTAALESAETARATLAVSLASEQAKTRTLQEQLTAATARQPGPRRPAPIAPAARRSASDPAQLTAVLELIRPLVAADPDIGRNPIAALLREHGYSCSTDRAVELLTEVRRPHAVRAGGDR